MADENHKVRIEEHLKIKIGEAKNLQSRSHGSAIQRDVYCTVSLDQEEIFRTTTMEKTLNPFFGEEFQFEVPRRFRYLSIYVYDRDRHLKQDKVLGKVAIKREDLGRYPNKDHWFPIRPVDADSEVQGKANVEIKFDSVISKNNTFGANNRMSIKILECVDLTLKNGNCDPYASVTVTYSNVKKITKRTKVKKKTTCPQFDEVFTFDTSESGSRSSDCGYPVNSEGEVCEVCIALWHDMGMGVEDLFLGEVRIQLRGNASHSNNAWYYLQPRRSQDRAGVMKAISCSTPPGTRLSGDNSLGSLRLQVYYTADCVFPSVVYYPLRNLLLESVNVQPITSSTVYILGEIVTSKMEAAQPLVRIFMHHGQIVPIIRALANFEISKLTDPTTIFRGNTLVSKMMDEAMKLAGLRYLHKTLRPAMDLVFHERKPCEIDPTRVRDLNAIETNLANLTEYVRIVFEAIVQSAVHCPSLMCQIFHNLKECATKYFPENKEVRYSVISGFIFLRFFAPAILGPKLFDITNEQIDHQTNRTLTLISKTIQSLGNLVSARCAQQTCKEGYMERVHKAFATDIHIQALRQFLEIISASSNPESSAIDTPVVLKEGKNNIVMIKRAQGRKRFGRKNFKQRYFRLTTHDLTYSKTKGKDPLCVIPLADILAVERLNENSFKMKNMFQIVQNERTLYIQAGNCVEQKGWVDLLTKLCQSNDNRLQRYHPSAYLNGHWMCCNVTNELASGCSQVSSHETNLHTSLDPNRDLERIYSLIITHKERLNAFTIRCENQAVYNGEICIRPGYYIDDVPSCFKTIKQLKDITCNLQEIHSTYQKTVARETKYGSKQAPIGDDNYLHLAARSSLDTTIPWRYMDT